MALKFLNKKGWHTGSLRNIENVWKAEQKHEAEQRKLEELRKQIQDERERSEFRLLQEQAGLVPRQERLEFLYDSGLSVGKSIGSGAASGSGGSGVAFKALEETAPGSAARPDGSSSSSAAPAAAKESAVPGALFEDKPQSANDAWRKLHSDPLLLIRQREQEALARIKNNPVQMALIRKSVVAKKEKGESRDEKEGCRKKHKKHEKHSSSREQFNLEDGDAGGRKRKKTDDHKSSKHDRHYHKGRVQSEDESEREGTRRKSSHRDSKYRDRSPDHMSESKAFGDGKNHTRKDFDQSRSERHSLNGHQDPETGRDERGTRRSFEEESYKSSTAAMPQDSGYRRRKPAPKLSEEERAARLREMQMDAELHEEQRWKRVRKADEDDAREATHASKLGGRSFLDAAHKSVYGAAKGGSSTIEESVRRRTHYSQRGSGEGNRNAFRR